MIDRNEMTESDKRAVAADIEGLKKAKKNKDSSIFDKMLGFFSQGEKGNGNVVTEKRELPPFDGIKAAGMMNIEISQTGGSSVEITIDDNLQPLVETRVEKNTLYISTTHKIKIDSAFDVRVEIPKLHYLETAGAVDSNLSNIETDKLEVQTKGAGNVKAQGAADLFKYRVSGSGDLEASGLRTNIAKIKISGAGDVIVNVKDKLDVKIAGAGSVKYRGNPHTVKKRIAGAGTIGQIS